MVQPLTRGMIDVEFNGGADYGIAALGSAKEKEIRSSFATDDGGASLSTISVRLGVPSHVLRFWRTRFSDLEPYKAGRVTRYAQWQIDLIKGIRFLLHEEGMTIRAVQNLQGQKGTPHIAEIGRSQPDRVKRRQGKLELGVKDVEQEEWLQAELITLYRDAESLARSIDATAGHINVACERLMR